VAGQPAVARSIIDVAARLREVFELGHTAVQLLSMLSARSHAARRASAGFSPGRYFLSKPLASGK
jgi:hypothetical protein